MHGSENHQRGQGGIYPGGVPAAGQVQEPEAVHESVRRLPYLLLGGLQPLAAQVLLTRQPHGVQQTHVTPPVHSLQQGSLQ